MNILKSIVVPFTVSVCVVLAAVQVRASGRGQSIIDTPHNLSASGAAVSGASSLWSPSEGRVCVFCHTPHHATAEGPLWSRAVRGGEEYTPYAGVKVVAGRPNLASRLCLSCHDGTIALGQLGSLTEMHVLDASFGKIPVGAKTMLGTDLSDDHPVSFVYPDSSELLLADSLRQKGIKLVGPERYVECTSCHNPHNNSFGNFLVKNIDDQHDALCTTCHLKAGWDIASAHRTGGGLAEVKDMVAKDGCKSCHIPHNAGRVPLLKRVVEENNCYAACHRSFPYIDVWSDFQPGKSSHPISDGRYAGKHAPDEPLPVDSASKHVQCVDCHNPHQAGATAPGLGGPLRGVRGMTENGVVRDTPDYEFQICYKCHAGAYADDFAQVTLLRPSRKIQTYREELRFALRNPSFHPVAEERTGNGQSLLLAYKDTMRRIKCNDCHAPHGSTYPFILKARNDDDYPATASAAGDYPLCFGCHFSDFVLVPSTTPHAATAGLHKSHVLDHSNRAPCAACHDPHGVPVDMGASVQNNAHLVNFDTRFAGADAVYSRSAVNCSCTVDCHPVAPPLFPTRTRTFSYD